MDEHARGGVRWSDPQPGPELDGSRHVRLAEPLVMVVAGCSLTGGGGNLLGGRDKCWPQEPPRAASIWRGILWVDADGSRLATPEGDAIPLWPGRSRCA